MDFEEEANDDLEVEKELLEVREEVLELEKF